MKTQTTKELLFRTYIRVILILLISISLYTCSTDDVDNVTAVNKDTIKTISYNIADDLYYALTNKSVNLAQKTDLGSKSNFSISPSLPSGITLNVTNGNIVGTATAFSDSSKYTVKGTLSDGTEIKKILTLGIFTNEIWLKNEGAKYSAYVVGDGDAQSVTWGSSDTSKATVANGEVTLLSEESLNVVVYATRGSYSNGVNVSVKVTKGPRSSVTEKFGATNVIINKGVTSISNSEFKNRGVTRVTIPNGVTNIGGSAFERSSLTRVEIPDSVTTIGVNAFVYNYLLESVKLPENLTSISFGTFLFNKITNINIPKEVTVIGGYAFSENKLSSVTIPDKVETIGGEAFSKNNITNINLGKNVKYIGGSAFNGNDLRKVFIPSSVTNIDYGAFGSNPKLVEVSLTTTLYNKWADDKARGDIFGSQVTKYIQR